MKLTYFSWKNITRYYKEQSQTIQVVQVQGTPATNLPKATRALPLK